MKMKRIKTCLVIVLVLSAVLSGCVFGGEKKLGKDAALQTALADAGLTQAQVVDIDIELEKDRYSAWYEVDFESGSTEYEYKIDAYTGEIISSRTDG